MLVALTSPAALAQRGVGEKSGVAQRPIRPEVERLHGRILKVVTAPCKLTTGRSSDGTHLVIETDAGTRLNVHLGPADAIADEVAGLVKGRKITIDGFRTSNLAPGHYVARSIQQADGQRIELRDENLRPRWAGRAPGLDSQPSPLGFGRGPGRGYGLGRGFGMGGPNCRSGAGCPRTNRPDAGW
jgi:hypothetical protein